MSIAPTFDSPVQCPELYVQLIAWTYAHIKKVVTKVTVTTTQSHITFVSEVHPVEWSEWESKDGALIGPGISFTLDPYVAKQPNLKLNLAYLDKDNNPIICAPVIRRGRPSLSIKHDVDQVIRVLI